MALQDVVLAEVALELLVVAELLRRARRDRRAQAGTAASFGVDVAAGDFLTGSVNYSRQGDVFRQLNEEPTYLASGDLTVVADARLDRFGGWTGATRKATGFFRVEKSDGRWWMITPDGRHYVEFDGQLDTSQLPRPLQIGLTGVAGGGDWNLGVERNVRVEQRGDAKVDAR